MKNARLLAEILNNVKGIKRCSTQYDHAPLDDPDCPLCMIGNAIRDGIKIHEYASMPRGFADLFDITFEEAQGVIFPYHKPFVKGLTYYNKGRELMEKYSKAHLL